MKREGSCIIRPDLNERLIKAAPFHEVKEQGERCAGDALPAFGLRDSDAVGKTGTAYAVYGDAAGMRTIFKNEKAQVLCAFSDVL